MSNPDPRARSVAPESAPESAPEAAPEISPRISGARTRRRPSLEPLGTGPVLHVGVDENGLGPVLGPLIVTAVAFRFPGKRPSSLGALVGDSKALTSHEDPSLGEAWARALVSAIGPEPADPAEVLSRLLIDETAVLRSLCPPAGPEPVEEHDQPHAMCWPSSAALAGRGERFLADDALVRRCLETVRGWAGERVGGRFTRRTPLEFVGVRSAVVCAGRLNAAAREGRHRFLVDLHEMERLALHFHEQHGRGETPLDAVCGKVGGMDRYGGYFGPLSTRLFAVEAEVRSLAAYRFPGLGRIAFLQDADAKDPLVGLASLVGKWVRELLMARIVRWLQATARPEHLGPHPIAPASGYRDPNTKRLIAATELVRAHRGVPDRCFLR
jgi:hypothetical protein